MSESEPIVKEGREQLVKTLERPEHLDVSSLIKEKNCYFVHTIQTTNDVEKVSQNNEALDTKN